MMWKEKYRIGVQLIDEQHEELFRRVSDFLQIVENQENWEDKLDKVKETMAFMQDYVESHFHDEEVYQEEINFPDIENHKLAHKKFKEGIYDYIEIFQEEGFTEDKIKELAGKLMAWLIMHVGKMDQMIGEYVNSKGGKA